MIKKMLKLLLTCQCFGDRTYHKLVAISSTRVTDSACLFVLRPTETEDHACFIEGICR